MAIQGKITWFLFKELRGAAGPAGCEGDELQLLGRSVLRHLRWGEGGPEAPEAGAVSEAPEGCEAESGSKAPEPRVVPKAPEGPVESGSEAPEGS